MITYKEARDKVLNRPFSQIREKTGILESLNCILAEDIFSSDDIPVNDNSAMDGFAVNTKDLKGADKNNPVMLRIEDFDIAAGNVGKNILKDGYCIKIMTGAPIPEGCDCVVKKEDVSIKDDMAFFSQEHKKLDNIRLRGEDIKKGSRVFSKGDKITPAAVGVLASLGIKQVFVNKSPKIGVISTGSELVDIDKEITFGKVRDSNSYSLCAQIAETGSSYIRYGIIEDDKDKLCLSIKKAVSECDIVLISGGVSVGDYDYIKDILKDMQANEIFWSVKQKPGKPLAFYILEDKLIFGLPGNPVSAMVCFEIYIRPLIRKIIGFKDIFRKNINAKITQEIKNKSDRTEFVRVVLSKDKNGNFNASKTGSQGSGILTSMSKADGLIIIDTEKGDLKEGETVKVILINEDIY